MDNQKFMSIVETAIENDDFWTVENAFDGFGVFCYGRRIKRMEPFPQNVFDFLVDKMTNPTIFASKCLHNLIMIFKYEWARFSAPQRLTIASVLEGIYGQCQNRVLCMVISEIIGEYFDEESAMKSLNVFAQAKDSERRAYVSVGIGCLLARTKKEEYKQMSFALLDQLEKDSAGEVRAEVAIVRAQIGAGNSVPK